MSNVIASLLVIVIVLVAIAIVWTVVRNIIQKNSEEVSLSQFTIDLKIESLRITNETLNAKIKRNPGEGDLKGITFLVFDGLNTHVFEKLDVELEPLAIKTFILGYSGPITKLSIAPIFETDEGKLITGPIVDVYYVLGLGAEYWGNCTPNCDGKQCGPDGCSSVCGICLEPTPYCDSGVCSDTPCTQDCSCAATTCWNDTCFGGCDYCQGELTLEEDCAGQFCGPSPHNCGVCAECEGGYHCDQGACVRSCENGCGDRECGPDPNECVGLCGICDEEIWGPDVWCDEGYCSNETCVPDCTGRECGPDPICEESCGECSGTEECTEEGICLSEVYLNNGTVFSVWPINTGIYFDSEDLPKSGVDYTDYYARFPGSLETRCLQIREFITPVIPEVYNMSHVRFVTSSTDIEPDDQYEIWETYEGCNSA